MLTANTSPWVIFINILCTSFSKLFYAQLIATCEWQLAQLSATCEWHNQHIFYTKKHGEIHFQTQTVFLSFEWKAVHKYVDEIDALDLSIFQNLLIMFVGEFLALLTNLWPNVMWPALRTNCDCNWWLKSSVSGAPTYGITYEHNWWL